MSQQASDYWKSEHQDLDLGDGHWLRWTQYEGERVGGIIRHTTDKTETGLCEGAFWLRGNAFNRVRASPHPEWDLSGSFEIPTLAPSFLCHCGDHGFVRDGKWVRA